MASGSEKRKEVLDGGRLLGVISRTDPEVYDVIRTLSEENGENPINVMVNIIKKYLMVQKIEQSKLSLEQILAAFELFKDIARESIRMYIDLAGLVFSDVSTAFGEIIEKKAQQLSKTENSVDREIKRRIYEEIFKAYQPMMNMVSVMMSSMMSNMMKNTMNVQGVNVNTQSAGNEKKDIPVNINIGT